MCFTWCIVCCCLLAVLDQISLIKLLWTSWQYCYHVLHLSHLLVNFRSCWTPRTGMSKVGVWLWRSISLRMILRDCGDVIAPSNMVMPSQQRCVCMFHLLNFESDPHNIKLPVISWRQKLDHCVILILTSHWWKHTMVKKNVCLIQWDKKEKCIHWGKLLFKQQIMNKQWK